MIESNTNILRSNDGVLVDETNMENHKGYPLKLPYLAVFICKEGWAVINVNFKSYLIKANEILVVSEDSITSFLRMSSDFKLIYCLIDKSIAAEIAYLLPNQLFTFLWDSPVCIPNKADILQLNMWTELLVYIVRHGKEYRQLMLRNHLQNLFLKVSEYMPAGLIENKCSRKEILCWQFWELIGKHCKERRDVAFYANELCITPFYLSQLTKGFMNDSPKGLIDRQVILEIKALLSLSDISIKEIAEQLHFEDTSYMNRYFKRYTGMSLSGYRAK